MAELGFFLHVLAAAGLVAGLGCHPAATRFSPPGNLTENDVQAVLVVMRERAIGAAPDRVEVLVDERQAHLAPDGRLEVALAPGVHGILVPGQALHLITLEAGRTYFFLVRPGFPGRVDLLTPEQAAPRLAETRVAAAG